jgi:hypothetical protein
MSTGSNDKDPKRRAGAMRLIGIVATACVAGLGAAAAALTVASLPDIKRYVRISRM